MLVKPLGDKYSEMTVSQVKSSGQRLNLYENLVPGLRSLAFDFIKTVRSLGVNRFILLG